MSQEFWTPRILDVISGLSQSSPLFHGKLFQYSCSHAMDLIYMQIIDSFLISIDLAATHFALIA